MSIFITFSPVQGHCGAEAYPSSHYVRGGQFRITTLTNKDTFGLWEVPGEPVQLLGEHGNSQKGPSCVAGSNQEPSCCEETLLTTVTQCH